MLHAATLLVLLAAGPAPAKDADCLACHEEKDLGRARNAVHEALSCVDCHAGSKQLPHPEKLGKVDCGACHDDVGTAYARSVHGRALKAAKPDAATCRSCHGPAHAIVPAADPAAWVSKRRLADTCGACHANPDFLARHSIPFARPVEAYRLSVHGRAVEAGNPKAPACSDCHGAHDVAPARDAASRINHWRVPETCGRCHAEIKDVYAGSVHGEAVRRGVSGSPVCTDCHGEHTILAPSEPKSLVNPARVSSVTCGRCHGDERLAARYNLPAEKVPAYQDSYHGLALRSGSQTVANCASCHGVHNILPSKDARSTIHPANLARTCGSCHPGAGERFAIGAVHIVAATRSEHAVVKWIRIAYLVLIPASLLFMLAHNALDFLAKLRRGRVAYDSREQVMRMGLQFRIAHALVILSFPTLVVTGFALKFPESWWAAPLLTWEGHLGFRGIVHRAAGVLLLLSMVYHGVHLLLMPKDRVILRLMWPRLQDAKDLLAVLRYNLGLGSAPPRFGAFSYAEKAEYLAFVWGSVIMAASGFVLWFNNWSLSNLPKWMSDAATAVHWYEAILATLSIVVWHFYMVIFDPDVYPMELAWLTGKVSAEHLKHTRPEYYRALITEPSPPAPEPSAEPKTPPGEPEPPKREE